MVESREQTFPDVPTIERELNELWAQKTDSASEVHQEAVTRACVLNLVVYTADDESARFISQIMGAVTSKHPSRVIVILAKPDAQPALDARASVQCHLSSGGRKQVCCEQILIRALGERVTQVPSLVRPLVVPDLPTFLWWSDVRHLQSRLLAELMETSERIIIDSGKFQNAAEGLRTLPTLIHEGAGHSTFSDLSWARLTSWRVSAAGFFDLTDYRGYHGRLERVRIDCDLGGAERRSIPSEAWLLAGWLASRLKWLPDAAPRWLDDHNCHWDLKSDTRKVHLGIRTAPPYRADFSGLRKLELGVENEAATQFTVSMSEDHSHLESNVTRDGERLPGNIVTLDSQDEAQVISDELEILTRDEVYEDTLKFLAAGLGGN